MSRCYINSAIPNLHDKKRTSSSCESKTHQAKGTNVGQEILGWGTVKGLQWLIERSARMTNHTCVFPVFLSPSEAAQSYDTWRQTNTLADTKLEYEKGGCYTYSITEHVSSHHSIISTLILYNNDIIMLWHWATQMTQQQSILCYIWRILSLTRGFQNDCFRLIINYRRSISLKVTLKVKIKIMHAQEGRKIALFFLIILVTWGKLNCLRAYITEVYFFISLFFYPLMSTPLENCKRSNIKNTTSEALT